MNIPNRILIIVLLSCHASAERCDDCVNSSCKQPEYEASNFLNGFDGLYSVQGHHSRKPVFSMDDKCIWCWHYISYFFVTKMIASKRISGRSKGVVKPRSPAKMWVLHKGRTTFNSQILHLSEKNTWGKSFCLFVSSSVTKKNRFISLPPGGTESFATGGLVFAKMLEQTLDWLTWCQCYVTFWLQALKQDKLCMEIFKGQLNIFE
jgi:hypothetical protein